MKTNKIYRITTMESTAQKIYCVPAGSLTELEQIWEAERPSKTRHITNIEVLAEGVNKHLIPAK